MADRVKSAARPLLRALTGAICEVETAPFRRAAPGSVLSLKGLRRFRGATRRPAVGVCGRTWAGAVQHSACIRACIRARIRAPTWGPPWPGRSPTSLCAHGEAGTPSHARRPLPPASTHLSAYTDGASGPRQAREGQAPPPDAGEAADLCRQAGAGCREGPPPGPCAVRGRQISLSGAAKGAGALGGLGPRSPREH